MAAHQKVKLVKLAVGLASVTAVAVGSGMFYQTQVLASAGTAPVQPRQSADSVNGQTDSTNSDQQNNSLNPDNTQTDSGSQGFTSGGRHGRRGSSSTFGGQSDQGFQNDQGGMSSGFGQSDQQGFSFAQPGSSSSGRTRSSHS